MHPTADTPALIFNNLLGRRVMTGVRRLPSVGYNQAPLTRRLCAKPPVSFQDGALLKTG